jgi:cytochrome P450
MTTTGPTPTPKLMPVSTVRTLRHLARDPIAGLERIAEQADGAMVRLHVGVMRPYLALHPDHVARVLGDSERYPREGTLWKAIQRLEGYGIAGEGPQWQTSRAVLQPLYTLRGTRRLAPAVAAAVDEAIDLLVRRVGDRPFDLITEMTRITHRVMIRIFFGNRISDVNADRLGTAIADAFGAIGWRTLLPMVPDAVPLPGDRVFRRACRAADEVIFPLVRTGRDGDDLVARILAAETDAGVPFTAQQVRDDLVGMFAAGTETTALTLTWLWLLLGANPASAGQVGEEVAEVVGDSVPEPEHLDRLAQTRMVLQETMRLYPIGWMVPRTVATADTIDGVEVAPGSIMLVSPYLTHRLKALWPDPTRFDPTRFAAGRPAGYVPFGLGGHRCLGEHFAVAEAMLVAAGILRRFRPEIVGAPHLDLRPRATTTLRPRARPQMVLRPR